MLFSTPIFLFLFFPLTYLCWSLFRKRAGDAILLVASLLFYTWGQSNYLVLVCVTVLANYMFARGIASEPDPRAKKILLIAATSANLSLLFIFKYLALSIHSLNVLLGPLGVNLKVVEFALPLGISFFTFHCMSYIFDVYRGHAAMEKPVRFFLYILLFPQLIAGPIIRYKDIANQFGANKPTGLGVAEGLRRFAIGLAKKVLIANEVGRVATLLFARGDLNSAVTWVAVACYTLQIYFDFSGYSDMAIGMMKMFGFTVPENFNYPYISQSIKEFWRRWHISLSTWFRDYLYIPLGGNRLGDARTVFNIMLVFMVSGIWHGANWTFLLWGTWHGLFVVLETYGPKLRLLNHRVLKHAYTMLVVMVGWAIFRSDDVHQAAALVGKMFVWDGKPMPPGFLWLYLDTYTLTIAAIGVLCATSLPQAIWRWLIEPRQAKHGTYITRAAEFATVLLLVASASIMSGDYYSPFIYFNF